MRDAGDLARLQHRDAPLDLDHASLRIGDADAARAALARGTDLSRNQGEGDPAGPAGEDEVGERAQGRGGL